MNDELVYSTKGGKNPISNKKKQSTYEQGKGPVKFRIEKKGRGGKVVSVLYDLPFTYEEANLLKRNLQAYLACGATLKDSVIELRGDNRLKIKIYFEKHKIKIIGC